MGEKFMMILFDLSANFNASDKEGLLVDLQNFTATDAYFP